MPNTRTPQGAAALNREPTKPRRKVATVEKSRVHIHLPVQTHDDLRHASEVLGEPIASLVDKAIALYLDNFALPNAAARAREARAARAAALSTPPATKPYHAPHPNDLP